MPVLAEWGELAVALVFFLCAHALPATPAIRSIIISAIGRTPYTVVYSALSVVPLMWIARKPPSL